MTGRYIGRGRIKNGSVVAPGERVNRAAGAVAQAQEVAGVAQAIAELPICDGDDGCGDSRVVRQEIGRAGGQDQKGAGREHQGWQQVSAQVISQRPAAEAQQGIAVVAQFHPFPRAVSTRLDAVILHFSDEHGRGRQGGWRGRRLVVPEGKAGELAAARGADGDPVGVHHDAAAAGQRGHGGQAGRVNLDHVVVGEFGQGLGELQEEAAVGPRQAVEQPAVPGVDGRSGPQLHGDAAQRLRGVARLAAVDRAADRDRAERGLIAGAGGWRHGIYPGVAAVGQRAPGLVVARRREMENLRLLAVGRQ